ncbi:DMT family transporter [Thalassospira lucentensis]|uniref:DMT family transporter n=1 Tax=Thalassospira lucentensis TaxID=168935 RepID=UPI003D2F45EB
MSFRNQVGNLHGAWLTFIGVLVICPDALLIRLIEVDDMTASFWRIGFLAVATFVMALIKGHYKGQGFVASVMPGRPEIPAGLFFCGTAIFFILSIRNTDAANTLVIIAATPLIAGVIGVLVFKRNQPMRTWVASVVVFVALALIVGAGFGGENALGDVLALGAATCMAGFFNVIGARPQINEVKAMLFGSCLGALILLPTAEPFSVTGMDWVWLLILGFWVLPVSFLFISAGARKIPAAEVGLIMLNEAILGSFLVWLVIDETPGQMTLVCGTIVIVTLVFHSLLGIRESRRMRAAAPL